MYPRGSDSSLKHKKEGDLPALKQELVALTLMYEKARDMEVEWRQLVPPDELLDIHEMARGWSTPIRNGIRDFLEVLSVLESVDRHKVKKGEIVLPSFNIVFDPPENVGEFNRRVSEYLR